MAAEPKRVTLVADELLGYSHAGGLGTATTFLAVALGRLGHHVEVLYVAEQPRIPLGTDWARLYENAGVALRILPRSGERTEPSFFARARDTERALRADPPDVVITQDLAAPAYTALRLRQLGLAFERTVFVVYCHGTRQWITDVARKVRVLPGALAVSVVEQASVELADVVVSPSAYLLEWMREQGWRLPEPSLVIPYLTRSAATGEAPPEAAPRDGQVRRIAFFGRLEERKGLRPFAGGLNSVARDLLRGVELEFIGGPTRTWPPERVRTLLSDDTQDVVRRISFETGLDQAAALAHLCRPGTLAVIPSLEDNSPNVIYECLERGIPFIASNGGGIAELVAREDRDRVLFDPTPHGVAAALHRALEAGGVAPARFGFDPRTALDVWAEVIAKQARPRARGEETPVLDVTVERRRAEGPPSGTSEWLVLLEETDAPDEDLVETLVQAQSASGADVVTCGVRLESGVHHYFSGDPAALGLISNAYGTVALIRRSLLSERTMRSDGARDPDWPLFARLVLAGARIVSVPKTLVTTRRRPGNVQDDPLGALSVLHEFERRLPEQVHGLARLAAGLASQSGTPSGPARPHRLPRLSRLLRRR
jgi:glycosyltransferase involved in cell wall biosynthesis